jgi:hypothetical protein
MRTRCGSRKRRTRVGQASAAFRGLLATVYRAVGRQDEARALIMEMVRSHETPPFFMALLLMLMDEDDEAYTWLNRGVDERGDLMHSLRTTPFFMSAWGDPRFAAVLERMRLGPPMT